MNTGRQDCIEYRESSDGKSLSENVESANSQGSQERPSTGLYLTGLAELPEKALLDEKALAEVLQVSPRTIRRMTSRFELPPGIKLRGRKVWFSGKVLSYLEAEADRQAREAERMARKLRVLSP